MSATSHGAGIGPGISALIEAEVRVKSQGAGMGPGMSAVIADADAADNTTNAQNSNVIFFIVVFLTTVFFFDLSRAITLPFECSEKHRETTKVNY
jgi:hypothetical protein